MQLIPKYIHFIYTVITLLMIYILSPIKEYESGVFVGVMICGVAMSLMFPKTFFSAHNARIFKVVYGILLLNVCYQFILGWLSIKPHDWLYLLAKYGTSSVVVVAIVKNPDFYIKSAYKYLACLIALMLLFGWASAETDEITGRFTFGFGNSNATGSVAAFAFAVFLIKPDIWKGVRLSGLFISLAAVMICGSRTGIVLLLMSFFFKYKLNYKLIFGGLAFLVVIVWVLPKFGVELTAIDRIVDTYDPETETFITNRDTEQDAGLLMFYNKFWTGYGLSAYRIVDFDLLPYYVEYLAGTHNGYLCAAKTYGIIGLLLFIGINFFRAFYLLKHYFKSENPDICLHLFVTCGVLVAAVAEDYLMGINSIITILFFTSISCLEYMDYFHQRMKPMNM